MSHLKMNGSPQHMLMPKLKPSATGTRTRRSAPPAPSAIRARVSGPPNSDLRFLTVRVDLLDPGDNVIGEYWHTYDLEQVPRGGPADLYIRIPQASPLTVGLALDMMLEPDPEEQARLVELQPDSASE